MYIFFKLYIIILSTLRFGGFYVHDLVVIYNFTIFDNVHFL